MVTPLHAIIEPLPHTTAILDGSIAPEGYTFEFSDENLTRVGFRRMVREVAYDVCDLAIVTYLSARDNDVPISAIPVFLTRGFDHRQCFTNVSTGVTSPADLEGKLVGLRYYAWTNATWARGLFANSYGVDLEKVTWVTSDTEHVLGATLPPNVDYRPDADLTKMLDAGELGAFLGPYVGESAEVRSIVPNSREDQATWYATTSILPIHHIVVVKDAVLEADPSFAGSLFTAFTDAKQPVVERIERGEIAGDEEAALAEDAELLGSSDPRPYGIEANLVALEAIVRYARDQHIIRRAFEVEDIFAT